jgi:hypothetical protein
MARTGSDASGSGVAAALIAKPLLRAECTHAAAE